MAIDESKPIAISAGHDDSLAIGAPTTVQASPGAMNVYTWDDWKKHFCEFFPQKNSSSDQSSEQDPAQNPMYREPVIDDLKKQKFAEIESLRRKQMKKDASQTAFR